MFNPLKQHEFLIFLTSVQWLIAGTNILLILVGFFMAIIHGFN